MLIIWCMDFVVDELTLQFVFLRRKKKKNKKGRVVLIEIYIIER